MKYGLMCAAALLALSACGREQPKGQEMSPEEVADELSEMKINPGEWEATNEIVSVSAPGVPADALGQMTGQKTSVRNCITPEQAAKPNANFLAVQENSNCTYQDWSMDGGRMSGTMTCTGGQMPGKMVMKMDGTYDDDSYDMAMDMESSGLPGGMTMTIKARTTGKRVGECVGG